MNDPTYGYATVVAYAAAGMQTRILDEWYTIQTATRDGNAVTLAISDGGTYTVSAEKMIHVRFPMRDVFTPTPTPDPFPVTFGLRRGDKVLIEATVYCEPAGEDEPPEDYYTFEIDCGDRQTSPPTELVSMNSTQVHRVVRRAS